MSSDRVIVEAIKVGQNLLSQNLPPAHSLTDAATVMRFRELVRSQAIRSALERSSDTFPAFVLREVGHVVTDQSKTNRQIISRLWGLFDDRTLIKPWGSRITVARRSGGHRDKRQRVGACSIDEQPTQITVAPLGLSALERVQDCLGISTISHCTKTGSRAVLTVGRRRLRRCNREGFPSLGRLLDASFPTCGRRDAQISP